MIKFNTKINTISFILILVLTSGCCFASFNKTNVRTVGQDSVNDLDYLPAGSESYAVEADPVMPDFSEEGSITGFFKKKRNNRALSKKYINEKDLPAPQLIRAEDNRGNNLPKEADDSNKFSIDADKITYDDTEGNVYAKGHVKISAGAKNVVLKADEATMDKTSQTITLKGNVKVFKDDIEMDGETMVIDLNEENIIMDNPVTTVYSFKINAQESYLVADDIQMINGSVTSDTKREFPVVPKRFQRYTPYGPQDLFDPDLRRDTDVDATKKTYRIDAKEIVITCYKDHNSLLLKDSDIYFNNHKIVPKADIEIITDKDKQIIETNMPEVSTIRSFGTYLGYGVVRRLPKGQLLKIMPAIVYGDHDFGLGLLGRHRSKNSSLEMGYSTATDRFVARGIYKFGSGFALRYGRNAYISEGFMGSRRSGYAGQFELQRAYLDSDNKATFRTGTYAGLFSDYKKKRGKEHYFATTRFRQTLELQKSFFSYKNSEQDLQFDLSMIAQASATLYGTGHTLGVVRFGPSILTRLKKWESRISYFQGGIHGDSPFIFDKYRYGRSTIMYNERLNINNKVAIGYSGAISPNKDNYKDELITESSFYVIFGPKDIKLALCYDFIRDIGHADLLLVLGSESTKINFDKLVTKNISNPERKRDFYRHRKTIKPEDI